MKLYKHQKKQNNSVKAALKKHNHVIYGAATGFGKSIVMEVLIRELLAKGLRILVLAPTVGLVNQLYETLAPHKPYVARSNDTRGHDQKYPNLYLGTLDTTGIRLSNDINFFGQIDYIFWDEVHVSGNLEYSKIGKRVQLLYDRYYTQAKWIGFSATPMSQKWKMLKGWEEVIYPYQTPFLIDMGFLAEFKYYTTKQILSDKYKVKMSTGGYDMGIAGRELSMPAVVDDFIHVYDHYEGHKNKTLVFCATIEHAEKLHANTPKSHIIHSAMSDKEQRTVLEWFKNQPVATLFNVAMLTTGFDDPSVNLLILARPVRTKRLAIQMWGRGLRKFNNKVCTIVDVCGVSYDCGLPDEIRNFNEEDTNRTGGDPVYKTCDKCDITALAGAWSYTRYVSDKSILYKSVCPNGCVIDRLKEPPTMDLSLIRDSFEYRKQLKLEDERRRVKEKRKQRKKRREEKRRNALREAVLDTYNPDTATKYVKELIENNHGHYSNPSYAYYLIKDAVASEPEVLRNMIIDHYLGISSYSTDYLISRIKNLK